MYKKDKAIDYLSYVPPSRAQTKFISNLLYTQFSQPHIMNNIRAADILIDQDALKELFSISNLRIEDICYIIWCVKDVETYLLKNHLLINDHPFFQKINRIIALNSGKEHNYIGENIQTFCTIMYLESSDIAEHWNFQHTLDYDKFSSLLFTEFYANTTVFKLFLKRLEPSFIESLKTPVKNVNNPILLDLKTKTMRDILYADWNSTKRLQIVLKNINEQLSLPTKWDLLIESLHLEALHYYQLRRFNHPELNVKEVEHTIEKITKKYSIENIAKYNDMVKSLSNAMHKQRAYNLEGKETNNFESLVYEFFSDPFLKTQIIPFMYRKSSASRTKENKAKWSYYAVLIGIDTTENQIKTKRNKI